MHDFHGSLPGSSLPPQLTDILRLHLSPNSQLPGGGLPITGDAQTFQTLLPGQTLTFANETRRTAVVRTHWFTLLAHKTQFTLTASGAGDGDEAVVDLKERIHTYNGMVVPIDRVLEPATASAAPRPAPQPTPALEPAPVGQAPPQQAIRAAAGPAPGMY